jgi:TatD DNase family protein
MIIDTHCHIDLYPNPMDIVSASEKLGIITIGMTNLPSHFEMGLPHLKGCKKVRLALGMHPLMATSHEKEFPLFYKLIDHTSYIGEVGLDFSREGISTKQEQLNSFRKVLETVQGKNKILSIHSRRAEKEVLGLLKEHDIKNAIFHWYSGGIRLIDQITESGYHFSINPAMTLSENGKKIIQRIPKIRILTESDGPYIQMKNRIIEPKDIKTVIQHLSELYSEDDVSVENWINQNFKKLIDGIKAD